LITASTGNVSTVDDMIKPFYIFDEAAEIWFTHLGGIFANVPEGWSCHILFKSKVKIAGRDLSSTGNIFLTGYGDDVIGDKKYIQIGNNELVKFTKVKNSVLGTEWANSEWVAELPASRHTVNRYKALQVENKKSVSITLASNRLVLTNEGNFVEVEAPTADYALNFITAITDEFTGGTHIWVKVIGSNSVVFQHDVIGTPTGFKNVKTATSDNVKALPNSIVHLIESEGNWEVVTSKSSMVMDTYSSSLVGSTLKINKDVDIHHITVPTDNSIFYIKDLNGDYLPDGYFFLMTILHDSDAPLELEYETGNIRNTAGHGVDTDYLVGSGETFVCWSDGTQVFVVATGWLNAAVQALETITAVGAWNIVSNDGGATAYASGWSNAGAGSLRDLSYRKCRNYIEIHGQARAGTAALVFTLPATHRPAKAGQAAFINYVDGTDYTLMPASVGADGAVSVYAATYFSNIYQFNIRIPID